MCESKKKRKRVERLNPKRQRRQKIFISGRPNKKQKEKKRKRNQEHQTRTHTHTEWDEKK